MLIMILLTLVIDEKRKRMQNMHLVKLKGYWNGGERRNAIRLNISLEVKLVIDDRIASVKSSDISSGGIRLLLDEKIAEGTSLRLEIKLPAENHLVKTNGEVVWTKESKEDEAISAKRLFNTGIKFFQFQDSGDKRLFNFIHNLPDQKS